MTQTHLNSVKLVIFRSVWFSLPIPTTRMGSAATSDKLRLQEIVAVLEPQFFLKKKFLKPYME
jgi:hypothetical protein